MDFRCTSALIAAALCWLPQTVLAADKLDSAESKFAKSGDIRVHYKSLGEGETALVFVHGWTCDLTFWRAQVEEFAGKIRLLLIDLPGHGKSDKPKIEYTMDLFAKAIDAVLTDTGVKNAVLAGHSMGTPVVRQFYRLFPDKTRALIAVDGSFRAFPVAREQMEKFVEQIVGANSKDVRGRMIDGMFTTKTSPEVRKSVKDGMLDAPVHVAGSAMRSMIDPNIWKEDAIKVPVLCLMAKSPNWAGAYQEYVRKLAPDVDYQVMDGVGHFLMMEEPKAFNGKLAKFLKKHEFVK